MHCYTTPSLTVIVYFRLTAIYVKGEFPDSIGSVQKRLRDTQLQILMIDAAQARFLDFYCH